MAYVSLGLDRNTDYSPDKVAIGTDDGGNGNNVTVCIDKTVSLTNQDIVLILQAIERFLEDGRLNQLTNV